MRFLGPCVNGGCVGKVGVVLACAPSLDDLPGMFWDSLYAPQVVTVGVNRVTAAAALVVRDFFPQILYTQDMPISPFNGGTRDMWRLWKEAAGKSWRVAPREHIPAPLAPVDQWTARSFSCSGGDGIFERFRDGDIDKEGCCFAESSADAALNLLWRMGVRKAVLAGVDSYGTTYCKWGREMDKDQEVVNCGRPEMKEYVETRWKQIGAAYKGEMELWNPNESSLAVRVGAAKAGWGALL